MFKQEIANTPFCSEYAENLFNTKIAYDCSYSVVFGNDRTFLSTLRALVYPRMGESDVIAFSTYDINRRIRQNANAGTISLVYDSSGRNEIRVYNVIGSDASEWLKLISDHFVEYDNRFQKLEKVHDFFRKTFNVVCFINPKDRSTMIYAENMNTQKMHYLQCGIIAFLPWYFDPKDGVSEIEMQLINSLREKDPSNYLRTLEKMAEQYDFKTKWIRSQLVGVETAYERAEVERLESIISDVNRRIREYSEAVAGYISQNEDNNIRLLGLRQKIAEHGDEDSEIMEYFLSNKKLVLLSAGETFIKFGFKDYLVFYEEEQAEKYINNDKSYLYDSSFFRSSGITKAGLKKLLKAVFLDQEIKLRFCAAYKIDFREGIYPQSGFQYGYEFEGYTPNPHIDAYRCMGNYIQAVNQYLERRDYIGAIEQCCASAKSLNFADSTVMIEFVKRICGVSRYHNNEKCFELPDGSVVDTKGAIKYIVDQNKEGDAE